MRLVTHSRSRSAPCYVFPAEFYFDTCLIRTAGEGQRFFTKAGFKSLEQSQDESAICTFFCRSHACPTDISQSEPGRVTGACRRHYGVSGYELTSDIVATSNGPTPGEKKHIHRALNRNEEVLGILLFRFTCHNRKILYEFEPWHIGFFFAFFLSFARRAI